MNRPTPKRSNPSANSIQSIRLNSNIIIHSPSLAAKSSNNIPDESTGIKIRMKGYGAIVDNSGNASALSTSLQQQQNSALNFTSEPKL